ncbi:hypothetical protein FHQ08_03515 [Lactobacillus sp. CC-MHH1034]|uniref:hypothetical protein n=1 Tax=Agrilactobacillus fermenti TaxID=2586909 RepID=UPI001E36DE5C|nr:hypothetical protein [Agrilactobacillus fermenti]MCD2255784.1 hypothetical protein [Agrilactobacillus fermenti]
MQKIKLVTDSIRYSWVRFLISSLSIALGAYIITHQNYLDDRITHASLVGWLDDRNIGISIVFAGMLMMISVVSKVRLYRLLTLLLNAFVSGAIWFVFYVRDCDGAHNMTWIYACFVVMAIFGVALTGTEERAGKS